MRQISEVQYLNYQQTQQTKQSTIVSFHELLIRCQTNKNDKR